MVSGDRALEEGWERGIPESIWPQAMLNAIRQDVRALACARVINTIRAWREAASGGGDSDTQLDALRYLEELGEALFPEPPEEAPRTDRRESPVPLGPHRDEPTVDAWQLPPKPHLRRTSAPVTPTAPARSKTPEPRALDHPWKTRPQGDAHERPKSRTGVSRPPEHGFDDDEKPTHAFVVPDSSPDRPWGTSSIASNSSHRTLTETNGPTDRKPLSNESVRRRLASVEEALFGRQGRDEDGVQDAPPPPAAPPPPPPPVRLPPVDDLGLDITGSRPFARRPPPKPGPSEPPRPRASMVHVRSLYGVLLPFARELVPLAYERRSRRFWGRWREVAGDRGVRRPFIEELLRTASDPRAIVCELIAEVQSVDVHSVYALVDQLERQGHEETASYYEGVEVIEEGSR